MFHSPPRPRSPWHEGERALQRLAGVPDDRSERAGAAIRDHLMDQHRRFFPLLPFMVVGAVDPAGAPWATIQAGAPGFLSSPDPLTLAIAAARDPSDPADPGLEDGDAVGLLGIELPTRRRNRLNGTVRRRDSAGYAVAVEQSFGNCPRYIVPRDHAFVRSPDPAPGGPVFRSARLDAAARALVEKAETFFVATYQDGPDGSRHVDVSHRGGPPGFVRAGPEGDLTVPDFPGNGYFNTLGNIRANGRAGLVFVDFATGGMLQLTGTAELHLPPDGPWSWRVSPRQVVARPGALPLRWDLH